MKHQHVATSIERERERERETKRNKSRSAPKEIQPVEYLLDLRNKKPEAVTGDLSLPLECGEGQGRVPAPDVCAFSPVSPRSRRPAIVLSAFVALALLAVNVLVVRASLTLSPTSITSDGALNVTANSTSTFDFGSSTLKINTTNGGPLTLGNGLATANTLLVNNTSTFSGTINANTIAATSTDGSASISNFNVNGVINVKAYGAKCDGSTNDATAIQNAINAASSGQGVYIPIGTCLVGSGLTINTPLVFYGSGRGSILKASSPTFDVITIGSTTQTAGVRITNFQIEGSATDETYGKSLVITSTAHPPTYLKIDHMYFSGPNSTTGYNVGVNLVGANSSSSGSGVQYADVADNDFDRIIGTGAAYPIKVMGNSSYNTIENNRIICGQSACTDPIVVRQGSSYNKILNNYIDGGLNSQISIVAYISQGVGGWSPIVHTLVGGNTLLNLNSSDVPLIESGIEFGGATQDSTAEYNEIDNPNRNCILVEEDGSAGQNQRNKLIGNTCRNAQYQGILVRGTSDLLISNNDIISPSQHAANTYNGVMVTRDGSPCDTTSTRTTIVGNLIYASGTIGEYGIYLDNPSDCLPSNSIVVDNDIPQSGAGSFASGDIFNGGVNTVLRRVTSGIEISNIVAISSTLSVATTTEPSSGVAFFNGNVGIGTNAPAKSLEVASSGLPAIRLNATGVSVTADFGIDSSAPNYGAGIWRSGVEQAHFYSGGLSLGTYSNFDPPGNGLILSGNVGIGTSTPATTLQVAGVSSTIRIGTGSIAGCLELLDSSGNGTINYITASGGTLAATTTKPNTCQ